MSLEDDADDRPYRNYWDLLPIGLALLLTICGIGMFFFHFSAGAPEPAAQQPAAAQPGEVMIGIGKGQTIQTTPPAAPDPAQHP